MAHFNDDIRPPEAMEWFSPAEAWMADQAAMLIDRLGNASFDHVLADILHSAAQFQQFVLFGVPQAGDAYCVHAWHQVSPQRVAPLTSRYVKGKFHRIDPALHHLRQLPDQSLRVLRLHAKDISDADYKRHFFEAADLGYKLSILNDINGERLYLNFYKQAGNADFSDPEISNLCALTRFVCKGVQRHRALMPPSPQVAQSFFVAPPNSTNGPLSVTAMRALIEQRAGKLTAREKDVCARIIIGYTSEAIGLDLGIAESSVATYRKRAYAKLGICSHHELFALCLGGV